MSRPGGWWRLMAVVAMVLSLAMPQAAMAANPDMGGQTWSVKETIPSSKRTNTQHRNIRKGMKATLAKFYIGSQYGITTSYVENAISDGAVVIVYRTEERNCTVGIDCLTATNVENDLTRDANPGPGVRSFWDIVKDHPNVMFYLEVGNEPDRAGWPTTRQGMEAYRDRLNSIWDQLHATYSRDNFRWIASMPSAPDDCDPNVNCDQLMKWVMSDGSVLNRYDGVAVHQYAGNVMDSSDIDFRRWRKLYEYAYSLRYGSSHPLRGNPVKILLSEAGICWGNPREDKVAKAQEMNKWARNGYYNHEDRVIGISWFSTSPWESQCLTDGDNDGIAGEFPKEQGYTLESSANGEQAQAEKLAERTRTPDPAAGNTTSYTYFPETGKVLEGKFHRWWNSDGGLMRFGYPLTNAMRDNTTERIIQYTERQVFEYHPQHVVPNFRYEVQFQHLGVERARVKGLINTTPFRRAQKSNNPACEYFDATGHNLCYGFKDYWHSYGRDFGKAGIDPEESLALFGYPISEEFTDPVTGLTVQYFERAVFEYHPNNPDPYKVLQMRLGAEKLNGWQ